MDDFSIKPFKTLWGKDRLIKVREANKPQNYNFSYFFSKNLSPNRENTYLINRINFDIILGLIIYQPKNSYNYKLYIIHKFYNSFIISIFKNKNMSKSRRRS